MTTLLTCLDTEAGQKPKANVLLVTNSQRKSQALYLIQPCFPKITKVWFPQPAVTSTRCGKNNAYPSPRSVHNAHLVTITG